MTFLIKSRYKKKKLYTISSQVIYSNIINISVKCRVEWNMSHFFCI